MTLSKPTAELLLSCRKPHFHLAVSLLRVLVKRNVGLAWSLRLSARVWPKAQVLLARTRSAAAAWLSCFFRQLSPSVTQFASWQIETVVAAAAALQRSNRSESHILGVEARMPLPATQGSNKVTAQR